jgi:hypothetical protein
MGAPGRCKERPLGLSALRLAVGHGAHKPQRQRHHDPHHLRLLVGAPHGHANVIAAAIDPPHHIHYLSTRCSAGMTVAMPEPTVDDAIALLTDRTNQALGLPVDGMVEMRPNATLGRLEEMGATHGRAIELIKEALGRLGGELVEDSVPLRETQEAVQARSGVTHQRNLRIFVPEDEPDGLPP